MLYDPLFSQDTFAMIEACRALGGKVSCFPDRIEVEGLDGRIDGAEDVIGVGNSGLAFRFIGAIAALSTQPIVITGDDSIRHRRPIAPLLEALTQLGVSAFSLRGDGSAPISVCGPLHSGFVVMPGEDSQPVSALLAASSFAPAAIELFVVNPGEKPWINLTLNWFDRLGIAYQSQSFESYRLEGNSSIEGFSYSVPGDFSSAAFPLAAAALTGIEVRLENLDYNDAQGDKKLVDFLIEMGASIEIDETNHSIHVKKQKTLKGKTFDVNDCIDAVPILAVLGCFAEGETHLIGASIARKKESDRLWAIALELGKMGGSVQENAEGLTIRPAPLHGAVVDSHFDHRIAMALTVAALVAKGETVIENISCIHKTYPCFIQQMRTLGASLR